MIYPLDCQQSKISSENHAPKRAWFFPKNKCKRVQVKKSNICNATTITYAWEENNTHYDMALLTGIPLHIVNFVNHDKVTNQINTIILKFVVFVLLKLICSVCVVEINL